MSRIDFYHLQKEGLEEALPKLLQKSYESGKRVMVKVGTSERVEFINSALWTFREDSFLPHGSKKDGFAEQQPIWLTDADENLNQAEFLFLVDGAEMPETKLTEFSRVFNVFDGNSEDAVNQARDFWKRSKSAGFETYYWQQSAAGKWEQKI